MEKKTFYLVDGAALPEVYINVVKAKQLLKSGKAATIAAAVKEAGISRSAFYKYKDFIDPINEKSRDSTITLSATLKDEPGVLSELLLVFAKTGCNVITINQNIPYNGVAPVTISFTKGEMKMTVEQLIEKLLKVPGTVQMDIIGAEG